MKQNSNELILENYKKSLSKDLNKVNTVNFIDEKEKNLQVR